MPSSQDPPLSEYQQTVNDFIALLQALRAWRKVINLYYQGRLIGRATVNFAGLMQKSSHPEITIVDHFDDDPNAAIWRKATTPPAPAAPVATAPTQATAYPEPAAATPAPRITYGAFPPDPAKPRPLIDWTALFEPSVDFSYPPGPIHDLLSPEAMNAGLAALAPILNGTLPPIPDWQAGLVDLFDACALPDAVTAPDRRLPALDAVAAPDAPPADPNPYRRGADESEDQFARRLSGDLTRLFTLSTTDRDAAARGQAQILEAIRTGAPEIVADHDAFIQRLDPEFFHDPQGRYAALSAADPALAAAGPLKPLPDASVGFLVPTGKSRLQAWIEGETGPLAMFRPAMAADGQLYDDLDNMALRAAIHRLPPPLFEIYRQSEAALAQYASDNKIRGGDRQALFDLALTNLPFGFGFGSAVEPLAADRTPELPRGRAAPREEKSPPSLPNGEPVPNKEEPIARRTGNPTRPAATNRGLIFVPENLGKPRTPAQRAAQDFEAETEGAHSDIATKQRQMPGLRYDNPNPRGVPYTKFDGFRELDDGTIELIDAKMRLVPFWTDDGPFLPCDLVRQWCNKSIALKQNPGFTGVFEFPTQEAADEAAKVLKGLRIDNISVRVRP